MHAGRQACSSTPASLPREICQDREPNSSRHAEDRRDKSEKLDMSEVDVLMLRSDPSLDAQTAPWAAEAGILFGPRGGQARRDRPQRPRQPRPRRSTSSISRASRRSARRNPDHQAFATTSRPSPRRMAANHPQAAAGVGRVGRVQARCREHVEHQPDDRGDQPRRLHHRPGLCPAAKKGDIRLFLMNGVPLRDRKANMPRSAGSAPRTTSAATSTPAARPRRSRSARPS